MKNDSAFLLHSHIPLSNPIMVPTGFYFDYKGINLQFVPLLSDSKPYEYKSVG